MASIQAQNASKLCFVLEVGRCDFPFPPPISPIAFTTTALTIIAPLVSWKQVQPSPDWFHCPLLSFSPRPSLRRFVVLFPFSAIKAANDKNVNHVRIPLNNGRLIRQTWTWHTQNAALKRKLGQYATSQTYSDKCIPLNRSMDWIKVNFLVASNTMFNPGKKSIYPSKCHLLT